MKTSKQVPARPAEIVREYGPFEGIQQVHGITYDGQRVWLANGDGITALDPGTGERTRSLPVTADAGTAFDGTHLWQIADAEIVKVEPETGKVVARLPAPAQGRDSGLTWAEGTLFVGEYRARKIHQIDAQTGALLRTIESDRFVTGVSWTDGELWHATLEEGQSELRRVDPESGEVLDRLALPEGVGVSGLEADGGDLFYCGASSQPRVRAVRRPGRKAKG